ncbi:MAG: bifunctional diaminohydroxyphosphoribosylaminopyrimidine deaminase/5-amino-6-(5-phosphoribosylamino)uracil reductase RibD [Chthoniobacterales bacterium]
MQAAEDDETFMRAALREAGKGLGRTSPNPAVGAVLVVGARIVARGHHRGVGMPHAEVECLRRNRQKLSADATLFVTLEPCSTTGRTGRCTDAITQAGIRNVVVGTIDVNPRHNGRGIELLKNAGVNVRSGVLAHEAAQLNEHFNKWITTGRPFVIAKCGMGLDGRLSRRPEESRWLTSAAARRHAHILRSRVDAILIGAETLRQDDPNLTVRAVAGSKQPFRVVVSRSGKLPRAAKLFTDRFRDRTLVFRNKSLSSVLADLGRREITSVLIEGGGEVLGEALDRELIDKVQVYVAPLLTGGPIVAFAARGCGSTAEAARIERVEFSRIGGDVLATGYPRYNAAF